MVAKEILMCKLIAGALSLAAMLVTTPVTASPAFIVVAVALATGVGVSASQQPYETWQYTAKYGWVGGARADVSTVEYPLAPRSKHITIDRKGLSRRPNATCATV